MHWRLANEYAQTPNLTRHFTQAYYQTGNYANYLDRKFEQLARDLLAQGIESHQTVIDFGCGTGGLVAALRRLGLQSVYGTDISVWAINYGRTRYGLSPEVLQYLNWSLLERAADWLLLLDVLEHIPDGELDNILSIVTAKHLVVRLPVSRQEGETFVLPVSRNDPTHIQCHPKTWWCTLLAQAGYTYTRPVQGQAIYDSEGVLAAIFTRAGSVDANR